MTDNHPAAGLEFEHTETMTSDKQKELKPLLYKHKKRGTVYEVIGSAGLQFNPNMHDMGIVVVYRDIDSGAMWVRDKDEFFDGRFEGILDDRAALSEPEASGAISKCLCPDDVTLGGYQNQVILNVPETVTLRMNRPEREKRNSVCIDACLEVEIRGLWTMGIATTGCCCGHNKVPAYIGVEEEFIPRMMELGYRVRKNPLYPDREDSFIPKTIAHQPESVDVEMLIE